MLYYLVTCIHPNSNLSQSVGQVEQSSKNQIPITLLCIGDDRTVSQSLSEYFNKTPGITAIFVRTLIGAREYIRSHNPDCIISGYMVAGEDTLPLLKAEKDTADRVIVICADPVSADSAIKAYESGADLFFGKDILEPEKVPDLLRLIRQRVFRSHSLKDREVPSYMAHLPAEPDASSEYGDMIKKLDETQLIIDALMSNEDALISVRDPDGRYILANNAFKALFALESTSIIGKTDKDIFPEISADRLILTAGMVRKQKTAVSTEEMIQTADGIREFLLVTFPIQRKTGEVFGTGMIATDITRFKEMESRIKRSHMELIRSYEDLAKTEQELQEKYEALSDKEREIRTIFERIHDVFYRVDEDGFIRMASPSAARLFGYPSAEDIIGKEAKSLWRNPEERGDFFRRLSENGYVHDYEFEAVRMDGSEVWLSSSVRVLSDDGSLSRGYEGILRDISERKAYEKEKQLALTQIQKNLGELAILNDGIRNPLTVIQGYSSLQAPELYEKIKMQIQKIDDIVSQLDRRWCQSASVLNFLNRHYGYELTKNYPQENGAGDLLPVDGQ